MSNGPAQIQERIRIGGIKLSPELAQFSYTRPPGEPCFLHSALKTIAAQHITISYLSLSDSDGEVRISLLVEAPHRATVHSILEAASPAPERLYCLPSAGTITLFPHKNSLDLLGRVLLSCNVSASPPPTMLSSISALSLNTAYSGMDAVVAGLSSLVELPENHAPLRPQSVLVNMVETVAVYWEPVIRIYGFDLKKGMSLLEIMVRPEDLAALGRQLMQMTATVPGFTIVQLQAARDGSLHLWLTLEPEFADNCRRQLEESVKTGYTFTIRMVRQVEILFFHGPHFQDRYGIAEALFRCLDQQRISLHSVGCTGTSIFLTVGQGEAELARAMLSKDFVVP